MKYEKDTHIDYVSICTPNYLHDAHIRFALRQEADAICEKPLVLNPWNMDALAKIEEETGKKIYNILQLRVHPSIIALKNKIDNGPEDKIYDVDLTYLTSRGKLVLYILERRYCKIRRHCNKYRSSFFRYAFMDIWQSKTNYCSCQYT